MHYNWLTYDVSMITNILIYRRASRVFSATCIDVINYNGYIFFVLGQCDKHCT